MTNAQIAIIIYLCCFVCCVGGLWAISRDVVKFFHNEGYPTKNLNCSPFTLSTILSSLCPIFNVLVAITIATMYDSLFENIVLKVCEENNWEVPKNVRT